VVKKSEEREEDGVSRYESNQADAGIPGENPTVIALLMFLTPTTALSSLSS
jgi:hypothetical protein